MYLKYCAQGDIFIFESPYNFCLSRMEGQEMYNHEYQEKGANLLAVLLQDSPSHKDLIHLGESTLPKASQLLIEDSNDSLTPQQMNKDIFDKEDPIGSIPNPIFPQEVEWCEQMIQPSLRNGSYNPISERKGSRSERQLYQQQTRQTKIKRYVMKKSRRMWDKKVSYLVRKKVADNRERKNGRFIKKSPLLGQKTAGHKNSTATQQLQFLREWTDSLGSRNDPTDFMLE